jgi:hypothetical protein
MQSNNQPWNEQRSSKKGLTHKIVFLIAILVLLSVGTVTGGYYGIKLLESSQATAQNGGNGKDTSTDVAKAPNTFSAGATTSSSNGNTNTNTGSTTVNSITNVTNESTKPLVDTNSSINVVIEGEAKGDGVTNDTFAIQEALDEAAAKGGDTVYLPEGTYLVDPGLRMGANTRLTGDGSATIIKLVDNAMTNDNILKAESVSGISVSNLVIDGNRSEQPTTVDGYEFTQYGLYFGNVDGGYIENVAVHHLAGVGVQIYNSRSVFLANVDSSYNRYHGFELEQSSSCSLVNVRGHHNDRHGLLVSPGEQAGFGSRGNSITNFSFDHNGHSGISLDKANGDTNRHLSEGNTFSNGSIMSNGQNGVILQAQDKQLFNNIYIYDNGHQGIYLKWSAGNIFNNILLRNNSIAAAGLYDEILIEGSGDGYASADNEFNNINIIAGGNSRYGINEGEQDANTYLGTKISGQFTAEQKHLSLKSVYGFMNLADAQSVDGEKTFLKTIFATNGVGVLSNATLADGSMGGLDAPFGESVLRVFASKGDLQLVAPNGVASFWTGGEHVLTVSKNGLDLRGLSASNAADPVDSQDLTTKAYVDKLESRIAELETKLNALESRVDAL